MTAPLRPLVPRRRLGKSALHCSLSCGRCRALLRLSNFFPSAFSSVEKKADGRTTAGERWASTLIEAWHAWHAGVAIHRWRCEPLADEGDADAGVFFPAPSANKTNPSAISSNLRAGCVSAERRQPLQGLAVRPAIRPTLPGCGNLRLQVGGMSQTHSGTLTLRLYSSLGSGGVIRDALFLSSRAADAFSRSQLAF